MPQRITSQPLQPCHGYQLRSSIGPIPKPLVALNHLDIQYIIRWAWSTKFNSKSFLLLLDRMWEWVYGLVSIATLFFLSGSPFEWTTLLDISFASAIKQVPEEREFKEFQTSLFCADPENKFSQCCTGSTVRVSDVWETLFSYPSQFMAIKKVFLSFHIRNEIIKQLWTELNFSPLPNCMSKREKKSSF